MTDWHPQNNIVHAISYSIHSIFKFSLPDCPQPYFFFIPNIEAGILEGKEKLIFA